MNKATDDGMDYIKIFRAQPLTAEEKRVLRRMRDVEGYDGELVRGEKGGWWIGTTRVTAKTGDGLVCKVYISNNSLSSAGEMKYYRMNEDGLAAINEVDKEKCK